jgi:replicative DNA helicase
METEPEEKRLANSMTPHDLIELEKRLSTYEGPDRVVKSTEIRQALAAQRSPFSFKAKIPSLDDAIEGFEAGELVTISGLTGQGKTTFCQSLTWNFFLQNIPSLWFSFEMNYRQFLRKLPEELFCYLPLNLKTNKLMWIRDRIHEAKLKHDVRAVFIDHLHFLCDMAKLRNASLEIGAIVRGLKRIAVELNIIVFLIAHSTKIKFDEEPELDSIRDSSFIPQDSDIVLIIWRGKDKATGDFLNKNILKVVKSRRTGVMGKKIVLIYRDGLLWEAAE